MYQGFFQCKISVLVQKRLWNTGLLDVSVQQPETCLQSVQPASTLQTIKLCLMGMFVFFFWSHSPPAGWRSSITSMSTTRKSMCRNRKSFPKELATATSSSSSLSFTSSSLWDSINGFLHLLAPSIIVLVGKKTFCFLFFSPVEFHLCPVPHACCSQTARQWSHSLQCQSLR